MSNPTLRQLHTLQTIRDLRYRDGYSPTMTEIGDAMRINKVVVFEHVGALERKGLVCRDKNLARSLTLTKAGELALQPRKPLVLPVMGDINGVIGGAS